MSCTLSLRPGSLESGWAFSSFHTLLSVVGRVRRCVVHVELRVGCGSRAPCGAAASPEVAGDCMRGASSNSARREKEKPHPAISSAIGKMTLVGFSLSNIFASVEVSGRSRDRTVKLGSYFCPFFLILKHLLRAGRFFFWDKISRSVSRCFLERE